jgi:hypothetical protein
MSWGPGSEPTPGENAFLAAVCFAVVIFVAVGVFYVGLYAVQRRNLYISCRGPELLISEVLVNVLCAGVVLLREMMALRPPGQRLSCDVTRLFSVLHFCVNNSSQVREGPVHLFPSPPRSPD